jgi:hypothetical protein
VNGEKGIDLQPASARADRQSARDLFMAIS